MKQYKQHPRRQQLTLVDFLMVISVMMYGSFYTFARLWLDTPYKDLLLSVPTAIVFFLFYLHLLNIKASSELRGYQIASTQYLDEIKNLKVKVEQLDDDIYWERLGE